MSASTIAFIALACVFGGALSGMYVRERLPDHHLKDETLSIVKLDKKGVRNLFDLRKRSM